MFCNNHKITNNLINNYAWEKIEQNWAARFKKQKQLFEYQHLLLLMIYELRILAFVINS